MINEDIIEFPETPITEETFERQGWLKIEEIEEDEKIIPRAVRIKPII